MSRSLCGSSTIDGQALDVDAGRLAEAGWAILLEDRGGAVAVIDAAGAILAAGPGFAEALGLDPGAPPASLHASLPEPASDDLNTATAAAAEARSSVSVQIVSNGGRLGVTVRAIDGAPGRFVIGLRRAADGATRQTTAADADLIAGLTARERDVLRLIGYGLSTADIAKTLHRSVKTIEWHRVSLGNKLGVTNRVELARIAIRTGIAGLEPLPRDDDDNEAKDAATIKVDPNASESIRNTG